MRNDNADSKTSVPYDRLVEIESADHLERNQQSRNGYQPTVPISAVMGRGEPQATAAEHEELFAQYRDEEQKVSTPVPPAIHSDGETEDHQMDRSKRNGANGRVNNRVGERVSTAFSRKLVLANVLVNGLMSAVASYITYHCFNKAMVLFSWHPAFMSIGFLILMSQAVLTMSGTNYFTHRCNHRTKVFLHWLLQAVAGILISIASVCIFLNKVRLEKPHFQTLHGIFGLVTVCFTLASIAGGVATKFGVQLRQCIRPIYSKLIHGIGGTVAYLLGVVTIGLGVYSKWFQEDNDANVRLALVIAIGIIALYVVVAPITNTVQRIKTAARTTL